MIVTIPFKSDKSVYSSKCLNISDPIRTSHPTLNHSPVYVITESERTCVSVSASYQQLKFKARMN